MNKRVIVGAISAIAVVLILLTVGMADAHPARAKIIMHSSHNLSKHFQLRAHFLPSSNLGKDQPNPIGYVGLAIKPAKWFFIEPAAGCNFATSKAIVSPRIGLGYEKLSFWSVTEYTPDTEGVYWHAILSYKVLDWLLIGAEDEGWGSWDERENISNGAGPNIQFRWNEHFGLDLAVQWKRAQDEELEWVVEPEFNARVQLFF